MATTVNESYDINAVELVPWLPTDRPTIKAIWVRVTIRVTHQDKLDSAENELSMPFKVLSVLLKQVDSGETKPKPV